MDIILIVAAVISLLGGKLVVNEYVEDFLKWFLKRTLGIEDKPKTVSYSEKLDALTSSLTRSSKEMDAVLAELTEVAKNREQAVGKLETDLTNLQAREKELQERVEQLKNVPIPVAQEFARLTSSGEKRSARRDYILFGAGVVVSTVIAILLRVLGLG